MTRSIRLIHPIYLDVPMLVSFAAAVEGGLSFGAEVTEESTRSRSAEGALSGKLGLGPLFTKFLDPSIGGSAGGAIEDTERAVRKQARAHTEASVAILLYDRFRREGGYVIDPASLKDLESVEPGALVEVAGTIEKNAIDAMVDYIDAISILSQMGTETSSQRGAGGGKAKGVPKPSGPLHSLRDSLDRDRKRTPISNVLLRCSIPANANAIVTLRTENLRDLTLSELHKNSVRVLGKVTRVVADGEEVSPFENYGMALLKPETLEAALTPIVENEAMKIQFSEVTLKGPAVQILPLMVFV